MSVAEFKDIIKSKAYKSWFDRIQDSILKESASDLRGSQEAASKTSFYITESTIKELANKLADKEVSKEILDSIYNNLKNYLGGKRVKEIKEPYITNEKGLYFPRVSFDTISRILNQGFKDLETKDRKISDYYQKGHVYGIATKTLEQTIEKLKDSTAITIEQKKFLLSVLNDIHSKLEEEDLATSNLGGINYKLYAKYKKNKNRYLVELQLKETNLASGRTVAPITNALRRYLDPGKLPLSAKLGINFRSQDTFFKELIESKGSPSFKNLIVSSIVEDYMGTNKSKTVVEYSVPETLIYEKTVKVSTAKINNTIKEQKKAVKNAINKINNLQLRTTKGQFYSLTSLQSLLNSSLHDRIKANMGTGDSRNVLNYRTGRFAESAKVEKVTESRAGMITAFYTYMKNPYATFSEGGRQSSPRTRDPKLLIAKSIREIAATKVANRLRAVSL